MPNKPLVRVVACNRTFTSVLDPKTNKLIQREVRVGESIIIPKEIYESMRSSHDGANSRTFNLIEDLSPKEEVTESKVTPERADPAASLVKAVKSPETSDKGTSTKTKKSSATETVTPTSDS